MKRLDKLNKRLEKLNKKLNRNEKSGAKLDKLNGDNELYVGANLGIVFLLTAVPVIALALIFNPCIFIALFTTTLLSLSLAQIGNKYWLTKPIERIIEKQRRKLNSKIYKVKNEIREIKDMMREYDASDEDEAEIENVENSLKLQEEKLSDMKSELAEQEKVCEEHKRLLMKLIEKKKKESKKVTDKYDKILSSKLVKGKDTEKVDNTEETACIYDD